MNYYSILGVTSTAEDFVIKAAYKALMRAYHPDRVKGYEELVKKLNQAYAVLSVPHKRAEYDKEHASSVDETTFDDTDSSSEIDEDVSSDWKVIVEYYPELEMLRYDLGRYSSALSTSFMLKILESKDFKNYRSTAKNLKKDFLKSYFGTNGSLVFLAEKLLLIRSRKPLLEINGLVRIMGEDIDASRIIERLIKKYPEVDKIYSHGKLAELKDCCEKLTTKARNKVADFNDLNLLSLRLGLKTKGKKGLFKDSWEIIDKDGKEMRFYDSDDFELYLVNEYDSRFGR